MSSYLYDDWMTNPRMLELAWEAVTTARSELNGWSDAKARSVDRYLASIVRLCRLPKWAIVVEQNAKYLKRLTEGERLAINILARVARGDTVSNDQAEIVELERLHGTLERIQAVRHQRIALAPDVAIAQKQRDSQSKRARLSRGRGEDGRNLSDLIADLARVHPNDRPREIWPHLRSSLEEWAGACVGKTRETQEVYEYPFGNGRKTIGYKQFSHRLRQARQAKKPV